MLTGTTDEFAASSIAVCLLLNRCGERPAYESPFGGGRGKLATTYRRVIKNYYQYRASNWKKLTASWLFNAPV
jgi:hypothetical protein